MVSMCFQSGLIEYPAFLPCIKKAQFAFVN